MTPEIKFTRQFSNAQTRLLLDNGERLARLHPQDKKRLRPACRLYVPNRHAQWFLASFEFEMPMVFWGLADVGDAHPLYKEIYLADLPETAKLDAAFQANGTLEDYYQEAVAYRLQSCGLNRGARNG